MNYFNQQPFNMEQFQTMARSMPENMLSQLVIQAQMQGIKQTDIENGLKLIKSIRNQTSAEE